MIKDWKDKRIRKFLRMGKTGKFKKLWAIVMIALVCVIAGLADTFCNNFKKIALAVASLLVFAFCTSFAFPVNKSDELLSEIDLSVTDTEFAPTFNLSDKNKQEITDDEVLQTLNENEFDENVDMYSAESIIENNNAVLTGKSISVAETGEGLPDVSPDDWQLILINKQHAVPDDYDFNIAQLYSNIACDERVLTDLVNMLDASRKDGVDLFVCSAYRDVNRQQVLFEKKINMYMQRGLSYTESYEITSQSVTVPGASEHQIGMAFDIVTRNYQQLNSGFGETQAGKWLKDNCADYGFILRYPEEKEDITGITYEPWHFRYVGVESAKYIMENGITLEEYIEELERQ